MCAMRVFELQAQGKPLISNYAKSVFNKFPQIRIIPNTTSLDDEFCEGPRLIDFYQASTALQKVMLEYSSYSVVSRMMGIVGLSGAVSRPARIAVFASGPQSDVCRIEEAVARQCLVDAHVVGTLDGLHHVDSQEFGYVAVMDASREYGDFYLASRLTPFVYTQAEITTQVAGIEDNLIHGVVHDFVGSVSDPSLSMIRSDSEFVEEFLSGSQPVEASAYAVEPFHVDFDPFHSDVSDSEEPVLSVIIPVHNNGWFLVNKCLPSLMRNNLWENMEIVLIDDGSDDSYTLNVCRRLQKDNSNVVYYRYNDRGSGSASRPRNKGIQIARGRLVTFLDPDNEISSHGYDKLVSLYEELHRSNKKVDFVSGYQVKVAAKNSTNARHVGEGVRVVDDPIREFFDRGKFPVVSTQAAVISRIFLLDHGITYVENAVGQDTLFGWEVLARSGACAFTADVHLIYYAERLGSVTNSLNPKFFERSLILENAQVKTLKGLNLLDTYRESHLPNFVKNWYIPKLLLVSEENREYAAKILEEIIGKYGHARSDFGF